MLKKLIRSPHILEVFVGYGTVHICTILTLLYYYNVDYNSYFYGLLIGGMFYTFIEYWFHRKLLHHFPKSMKKAHDNHHKNMAKLKIICTPLLPVQIYEILMMLFISYFFGSYQAVIIQTGVSISQIIMDSVHLFEHSQWRPWFLRSARSYHMLHHKKCNHDYGFGLTTCFWDLVFGTLPDNEATKKNKELIPWKPFENYIFLKYLQLPIPLLGFILYTPFVKTTNLDEKSNISKLKMPKLDDVKYSNIIIAFISGLLVSLSPFFITIF